MNSHAEFANDVLANYDKARITPGDDEVTREMFLSRVLAEAQVHATLAVAEELEKHRMAGWGQRA